MRIALGQLESGADIRANIAAIDRFAAEAAHDGAALVAFPEYATYEKKKVDATFPEVAEPLDGPVYVAGVCQAPPVSVGRSVLVDPMGVVEADLGLEAGVLAVEVSLETVDRVRESFPMFRQRRL